VTVTRIYVDDREKEKRKKIEEQVNKVLARYPNSLLVEIDPPQINRLRALGYRVRLETREKLKTGIVEFDPSKHTLTPPSKLAVSDDEFRGMKKKLWIIQFLGPVQRQWIVELKSLGVRLNSYVPDYAYLSEMSLSVKAAVERLSYVRWVGAYEPVYKISPLLMGIRGKVTPSQLSGLAVKVDEYKRRPDGNINVKLHDPEDIEEVSSIIRNMNGEVIDVGKDRLRVSLDPALIPTLAKVSEVKYLEPYLPPELANDEAAEIVGVKLVWENHGLDGEGQTVGIGDTGLDVGVNDASMHEDFKGRIVKIYDLVGDGAGDVRGGHGTHVAGSVLGSGYNSNGEIRGMAPAANLILQAMENKNSGTEVEIPSDLYSFFKQAYDPQYVDGQQRPGARIHSNSWGTPVFGYYCLDAGEIDDFVWNHRDMVILFASHNFGTDADGDGSVNLGSVCGHACAKNAISVGASESFRMSGGRNPGGSYETYGEWKPSRFPAAPMHDDRFSDNPQGIAPFSGRGPTDDGRIKPDVVAPGTNILSTKSSVSTGKGWGLLPVSDPRHSFYFYMGGTSMATPVTAGVVTLIRQYLVEARGHTPSAALVKAFLIHGAESLSGQYLPPYTEVGQVPDSNQGWGRVSLAGSLFPDNPSHVVYVDDMADVLDTGDYREITYKVVDGSAPFKVTMVYTDFPADSLTRSLVNELCLSVKQPNNVVVYGPSDPLDIIDNVQQVNIPNPVPGNYTVRVDANLVVSVSSPMAPSISLQDFALVVSGGLEHVDLYIRDNTQDQGHEPSTKDCEDSPDIDIRPVGGPLRDLKEGETGSVTVSVRNRGTKAADNASVKLFWAEKNTATRAHWKSDDIKVGGVAGNTVPIDVPAHGAAGPGSCSAVFDWLPPGEGEHLLFATVDHPDDPIEQEDLDRVRWEDNLACKNVKVVKEETPVDDNGPCFTAVAAMGSMLIGPVQFLREYRDETVLMSRFKAMFLGLEKFYYRFSPRIAWAMKKNEGLKQCIKYCVVYPYIYSAKAMVHLINIVQSTGQRNL